jgi:hypothetical protein
MFDFFIYCNFCNNFSCNNFSCNNFFQLMFLC